MTENYALLGGSIKIDPTDFDASALLGSSPVGGEILR